MTRSLSQQTDGGCTFCADAGPDFDYCRICGRGEEAKLTVEPLTGLRLAVRVAKGSPLSTDGERELEAFRLGLQTEEGQAMVRRVRGES